MYDLGADPFAPPGAARRAGRRVRRRVPVQRHHGRVLRRRRGLPGPAQPRPPRAQRHHPGRPRPRPNARSGPPGSWSWTPRWSARPARARAPRRAPTRRPATCAAGRGEVSQVTRSFLGQVMTSRPCPACGGFGTIIRRPCPECDARRPGPHPAHDQGPDPGGRRGRHAHPAGRARARSAPAAGRPATCSWRSSSARTRSSSARATTCTAR